MLPQVRLLRVDEDLWRCFSFPNVPIERSKVLQSFVLVAGVLIILDGHFGFAGLGWTLALCV